ncbi:hypothetical protein AAHH78_37825, partial [Burkholderia pseudomallei]
DAPLRFVVERRSGGDRRAVLFGERRRGRIGGLLRRLGVAAAVVLELADRPGALPDDEARRLAVEVSTVEDLDPALAASLVE